MNVEKSARQMVRCRGVVQLEDLVLGSPLQVRLRLRLISLLYCLKVPFFNYPPSSGIASCVRAVDTVMCLTNSNSLLRFFSDQAKSQQYTGHLTHHRKPPRFKGQHRYEKMVLYMKQNFGHIGFISMNSKNTL